MATTTHNFHVPLPKVLYERLREEATRSKQPATALAREAIDSWLKQKERELLAEQLSLYVEQHAGSEYDLDEEFEEAAVEHLLSEESNK